MHTTNEETEQKLTMPVILQPLPLPRSPIVTNTPVRRRASAELRPQHTTATTASLIGAGTPLKAKLSLPLLNVLKNKGNAKRSQLTVDRHGLQNERKPICPT